MIKNLFELASCLRPEPTKKKKKKIIKKKKRKKESTKSLRFTNLPDEKSYLRVVVDQDKNSARYWLPFHELADMSPCAYESRKEVERKTGI